MLHSGIFLVFAGITYIGLFFYLVHKETPYWRHGAIFILYVYTVMLLARKIFPIALHGNPYLYNSLIPGAGLYDIFKYYGAMGSIRMVAYQIAVYIPLGFFATHLNNRIRKLYHIAILGVIIFGGIELLRQVLIPLITGFRYVNFVLDDLFLVILGVMMGFAAKLFTEPLVNKIKKKLSKDGEAPHMANEENQSPSQLTTSFEEKINDETSTLSQPKLILRSNQLTKVFGSGDSAVKAVDKISVSFYQGDFAAIIGASGSGKSTLLHLLSTLDSPTSGQVIYNDQDIFALNRTQRAQLRRRQFGFVFQFFNLVPTLTVRENITLPILMDGAKPDQAHIDKLINMLDISDKINTLPSKLSGGQQQRVAIARALAAKPAIVFADEPTGNLDSKASKNIIGLFKETAQAFSQTMIIVTHDPSVASCCSRVIEIEDGTILRDTRGEKA